MKKIIVHGKRPLKYGGKLYRTGDAAHVSRQHARVLVAMKRAVMAPATASPAAKPGIVLAAQGHTPETAPSAVPAATTPENPTVHAQEHHQAHEPQPQHVERRPIRPTSQAKKTK